MTSARFPGGRNPFNPLKVNGYPIFGMALSLSSFSLQSSDPSELGGLLVWHVGEPAADQPPVPVVDGWADRLADLL